MGSEGGGMIFQRKRSGACIVRPMNLSCRRKGSLVLEFLLGVLSLFLVQSKNCLALDQVPVVPTPPPYGGDRVHAASLFVPHEIYGVGGYFEYTQEDFSVMTCIVAATAAFINDDPFLDIVMVADGATGNNQNYVGLPTNSYLYAPGEVDENPVIDISPNVWAGGIMPPPPSPPTPTWNSLSPIGLANIKGYPGGGTYAGSDIGILYGDGRGHFRFRFVLSNGGPALVYNPRNVRTGDFDGDGRVDIVVFNNDGGAPGAAAALGGCSVVWYRNNGGLDPTFDENPIMRYGQTYNSVTNFLPAPRGGAVADINRDGRLDVFIAEYQNINNMFWVENIPGPAVTDYLTFTNKHSITPATIGAPLVIWAGRFDNDQDVDILIGRNWFGADAKITLLKGKPNPDQFHELSISPDNFRCSSLAVADFNGDGNNDVVGGAGKPGTGTNDSLAIFYSASNFNNWDRIELPNANNAAGEVAQVIAADLNGDGRVDIAAAFENNGPAAMAYNAIGLGSNVHVWINQNVGGSRDRWLDLGLARDIPADNYDNGALVAGDFTGDNQIDLFNVHYNLPAVLYANDWANGRSFHFQATSSRGRWARTTTLRRVGARTNLMQGDANGHSVQDQ